MNNLLVNKSVDISKKDVSSVAKQVERVKEEIKIVEPKIVVEEKPKEKVIEEKVEQKIIAEEKASQIKTSVPTNSQDGKRVWGTVVRKLRQMEGKTILWVACQEMSAKIIGNTLFIETQSESERALLLKDDNLQVIKELTASFGDFDVKIAGEEDIQTDNKEKVSEFFKDTLQIK